MGEGQTSFLRLAALAAALGLAALPASADARAPRMAAVGVVPPALAGSQYEGALAATTTLHLTVVLAPRDEAALTSFVDGVSTPRSPTYGHYLAPGQFGQRFGASAETIAAVSGSLRAAGLEVGSPSSDGLAIPVTAEASVVAAALHTGFARYRLAGRPAGFANTAAPLLPADLAGAVRDVVGLQTLTRPQAMDVPSATDGPGASDAPAVQATPDIADPSPCALATATAAAQKAYTIDQLAEGYDLDPFYADADSGAGTTVGIYELEPDLPSDISSFESCFGANTSVQDIPVDGGIPGGAGVGEAAIDIESVIGIAPQSQIEVFQGPATGSGPLDTYLAMADEDTSQVNTTSWGLCEQDLLVGDPTAISDETPVFQQMVAQGQTLYAATGDDGSEGCMGDAGTRFGNALAVSDPASQPQVTGVGGTSLVATYSATGEPSAIDPTPLAIPPFQTVWNESVVGGGAGGGGISIAHAMPSYQSDAPAGLNVINASSSGAPCGAPAGTDCREVPDISAVADPVAGTEIFCTDDGTPDTICQGGNSAESKWQAVGGTSAGAPFWAGLTALINSDTADGCAVPATFGLINPLLYEIAGGANHASALTDITPPGTPGVPSNNDYMHHHAGLYPVGGGYDMATGLGTPLAGGPEGLAHQLCALRAPVTQAPTLSSLSPSSGPATAGAPVTIDGAFFVPGASVSVGGTPATNVQVTSFNQITAVLPAGSGAEPLTVTTSHGTGGPLTYTYPPPATPNMPAGPSTPTTPSTPQGGPPAPPTATKTGTRSGPNTAQLLLTCTRAKLAIIDVVEDARRVEITGAASTNLAGRKVEILFGVKKARVASGTVAASGLFSVAAPLPQGSARTGSGARYEAAIGNLDSAAVGLTRRLILEPPEEIGGRVTLTGRVVAPLADPPAAVLVRQSTGCSAGTQVASIKPSPSGRFTLKLPAPAGVRAALYRLATRVRQSGRTRSTSSASSLLEPVALS